MLLAFCLWSAGAVLFKTYQCRPVFAEFAAWQQANSKVSEDEAHVVAEEVAKAKATAAAQNKKFDDGDAAMVWFEASSKINLPRPNKRPGLDSESDECARYAQQDHWTDVWKHAAMAGATLALAYVLGGWFWRLRGP